MPRSWMLSIASGFLSNSFLGEIPDLLGLQPLHGWFLVGSIQLSPHSRLRRQCGVTQIVTARAVNIARQSSVSEVSTARAVNIAGNQVIIYIAMKAPKVLYYA